MEFLSNNIEIFCCPRCSGNLNFSEQILSCVECQQSFLIDDGIPRMFWPNEWDPSKEDVTDTIKSFYESTPFPNYDGVDDAGSLRTKAKKSQFASLLDDQIPFGTRILECGCGTGQLTNFLSLSSRTVIGTDMCLNSLSLASKFKDEHKLKRADFAQMNLFRPCFKPQSFDMVISNGVLHHTSDPALAFKTIANLVKPNGYILIGLYHRYGRLVTDIRRLIFKYSNARFRFLDRRAVSGDIDQVRKHTWFLDQYRNPHESKHTVGEVLTWLDSAKFSFVHSIPKTVPFESFDESERLFKPDKLGNLIERMFVAIGMIFTGHREGGLFIVIAKKR